MNSTGQLVLSTSSYLVVSGDVDIINNGTITINGTLSFTGDLTEESGSTTTWGANSNMQVAGGGTQNLVGISSIDSLTISNNSQVVLAQNTSITSNLTLTSGTVSIGNFNLTIGNSGTISGASSSNYIVTGGSGVLIREVGASSVSFPVGTSSGYNPISLSNSGTTDNLSVSVSDNVLQDGSSGSTISSRVVNRTWNISEGLAGSLNLSATFQWVAADELSSFDRSNAVVYHYTGGAWIADGTTGSVSGSDPYSVTVSGISSLSPFSVGDDMTVFPVEYISFTATQLNQMIRLNWETASELNSDYFAVERRDENASWRELGSVPAAGFSNDVRSYSYEDAPENSGRYYYRLRQVDLDGSYAYSDQLEVQVELQEIRFYPNPVSNRLSFNNPGSFPASAVIYDVQGRKLQAFDLNPGKTEVSLDHIPAGFYHVRIRNQQGLLNISSFVKR